MSTAPQPVSKMNQPIPTADCEKSEFDSVLGNPVAESKYIRKRLDAVLQELKTFSQAGPGTLRNGSRERSLAITKIQEGIMWMGLDLKSINEALPGSAPNPYPHSYDPKSPVVEKTADGLKL